MTCDDGSVTRVEVQLLGGFSVSVDGEAVPAAGWSRRHAAALVKVLALAPGRRLHREQVIDARLARRHPRRGRAQAAQGRALRPRAIGVPEAVVLRRRDRLAVPRCRRWPSTSRRFEELARQALAGARSRRRARGADALRRRAAAAGPLRGLGRAASRAPPAAPPRAAAPRRSLGRRWSSSTRATSWPTSRSCGRTPPTATATPRSASSSASTATLRRELGVRPGREALALRDRLLGRAADTCRAAPTRR